MQVPISVVKDIEQHATDLLNRIYDEHLMNSENMSFQEFYSVVFSDVMSQIDNLLTVGSETVIPIIRKRSKTKKRWLDKELQANGTFYEEFDQTAKAVYEKFAQEIDKVEQLYGYRTFEELREAKLTELQLWCKADGSPVCHFPYLSNKAIHQIRVAMVNDLEYIILHTISEKCPNGAQSAIMEMPNSLSNVPIAFSNRGTSTELERIKLGQEEFFLNKYYIDDTTVLENLINVEIMKTGVLSNVLRTLSSTDVRIFLHLMSLRDENFYATREVVVDIGDLVKHVFVSDGAKNYTAVKESLYRMQYLNSGAIDASLRGFTVKLFDNVTIYNSQESKETARIVVNVDVVTEYIKNQTIHMYREIIDKFKTDTAKVAIFPLQRERIRCSANTKPGEPLVFHTNTNFFRGVLYFSSKRKREHYRIIEKMLQELIDNEIAVKDYVRKGDTFILEFYPISDQERRDLINSSNTALIETTISEMSGREATN